MNHTHDPSLRSWVESANDPRTDFPIQNLPFGVFRRRESDPWSVGVAIGDEIIDLRALGGGAMEGTDRSVFGDWTADDTLGGLFDLGLQGWRGVRQALSDLLRADTPLGRTASEARAKLLVPQASVVMRVPVHIGDFTDFYASVFHATNVGSMFRPDNPLLPNYKWIPVGYHGRSSSIVISGTPVRRPAGQTTAAPAGPPTFGPSRRVDYEAELGILVGTPNDMGAPVPIGRAGDHIFGVCLLNDWSARDIQPWEYQPLGPFLAKNFATTVSPWVVTMEALEPFRTAAFERPSDDPQPLEYLNDPADQARGGLAIEVSVWLRSEAMRKAEHDAMRLSVSSTRDLYWTPAQLLTHHASNGCNLRTGDLMGTGTLSGPEKGSRACMLELAWRGTEPVQLPTGESRTFLEDGDEVTLRGRCEDASGHYRAIGLGSCRGAVVPH